MSPAETLVAVRALESMDLPALRQVWRDRYGAPPRLRSVDLLRRMLAWRLQSETAGGLDRKTQRLLAAPSPPASPRARVREGVRMSREWKGRTYEVEAFDDAYILDGVRYASLSQAARAITGVRWNGPRFFGLREAA